MSKAREIIENGEPSDGKKWLNWATSTSLQLFNTTQTYVAWGFSHGRFLAWWLVTAGMITAVPLLFEVKRESLLEDLERVQINSAIAQGSTPQELAQQGMNAIEPPVLKK